MESKKNWCALSRRSDFLNLKTNGTTFHVNSWLLVSLQKNQLNQMRCGWTIPRQIGGAVVRNRFKRWGREYLRHWTRAQVLSFDLNLIFKRKEKGFYSSVSHKEFDEAMDKMLAKVQRYDK